MKNIIDEDELDAFLWEVETVTNQVNDILSGKVDIKKLEEKEKALKDKKEKEERIRIMKEDEKREAEEKKLKNGTKGKGEKDNYMKFCSKCFIEYIIDLSNCTHCNCSLITKHQRHSVLKSKVEELKNKKTKKMFRRQKYDNWIKTNQFLKSDKFSNYTKWELYESSSDEEEKGDLILPRHDPNFIALENQLNETVKQKEISRNKSIKLKDDGNAMMKEGRFKKAISLYTEAINETRSMMILYTNRALAYIKIEDYHSAVSDCDRVIEYLDVFEEEKEKNLELYVKAMSRKALSLNKLKKHDESIELLDKCLSIKKDEEIEKLLSIVRIEKGIYDNAMLLVNQNSPEFKMIDNFISQMQTKSDEINISESNVEDVSKIMKNDDNKLYFIQKGGLELVFLVFNKYLYMIEIIDILNQEEKYIIQVNNLKGYNKLVSFLINSENNELNNNTIKYIKKMVSILEDSSQYEFVRKSLNSMKNFDELFRITFIKFNICDLNVINNSDKVLILLNLYTFISNICFSSDEIRKKIVDKFKQCLYSDKFEKLINIFDSKNILHNNLLESLINLLSNLSCDNRIREDLNYIGVKFFTFLIELCDKIISHMEENEDLYEKILSLLYNISHSNQQLIIIILESSLIKTLEKFLPKLDKFKLITQLRSFMMVYRIVKVNPFVFNTNNINIIINNTNIKKDNRLIDNNIKVLAYYYSTNNDKSKLDKIQTVELINFLCEIFLRDFNNIEKNYERINNTMSLMNNIVTHFPENSIYTKIIINHIITIAKDKTDLLRKNSALLLAKIAKSSDSMQDYIRELHGMEVLVNIAKFIKLNK